HEPADHEESIMSAAKNRVRLNVEHLEDRCTPSAMGGGVADHFSAQSGGPQAAAAARDHAPKVHAIPFQLTFVCTANLSALTASATGFGTLGAFTGQGSIDSASINIDQDADRGEYSGTYTVFTPNGDQVFVSFTTSWRLSTGNGKHAITVIGGTGQFAGAS